MTVHFDHAPIVEAVLDIRLRSALSTPESLLNAFDSELPAYPTRRNLLVATASLAFGTEVATSTSQTLSGWAFESSSRTFQVRTNGFSFHMLKPYTNWLEFQNEARRLWDHYRSAVGHAEIARLGLRYVNKIDIPTSVPIELKEYLRTLPELSSELTEPMVNFFMRVQTIEAELQSTLTLTEMTPPSTSPEVSIILDIDLARSESVPQNEEAIWALFNRLRDKKNEVFLACITSKTKELLS